VKEILTPILYDFKRSILRFSTITMIVLFTLAGLGLSYAALMGISQLYPYTNIIALALNRGGECYVTGLVFDLAGNPSNAKLAVLNRDGASVYERELSGNFTLVDRELCNILGKTPESGLRLVLRSEYGEWAVSATTREVLVGNKSVVASFMYTSSLNTVEAYLSNTTSVSGAPTTLVVSGGGLGASVSIGFEPPQQGVAGALIARLVVLSWERGDAKLFIVAVNYTDPELKPFASISYSLYKFTAGSGIGVDYFENLTYTTLGFMRESYIGVFNLKLARRDDANTLVLRIEHGNVSNYVLIPLTQLASAEQISARGVLTLNVSYNLFVQFFPIVVLYLAYVLMAKPRSTGALEFVVARPITRRDVYLTRFLAGVLTIAVASAVFILGLNVGNLLVFKTSFDLYANTVLYAGLVAGLTAFYSLCYMIASSTRSGRYLALAIALYVLFALFWGLIVLLYSYATGGFTNYTENTYKLSYFNPLAPASTHAPLYVGAHYNLSPLSEDVLNPALVYSTPIAWIAACFTIGYYVFRKANLTG